MKTDPKLIKQGLKGCAAAIGFGFIAGPAFAQGTCDDPLTAAVETCDTGGGDVNVDASASASATAAANVNFQTQRQAPSMGVYTSSGPGVYNGGPLPEDKTMACVADIFRYAQSNSGAGVSASVPGFGFGIAGSSEGESRNELRSILDNHEIEYAEDEEGKIIGTSLPPVLQNAISYCGSMAQMDTDRRVEAESELAILSAQLDTFLATLKDRTSCERRQMNQDIATRILNLNVDLKQCSTTTVVRTTTPAPAPAPAPVTTTTQTYNTTPDLPRGHQSFEKGGFCDVNGRFEEPNSGRFINTDENNTVMTGQYCAGTAPGYKIR